MFLQHLTLLNYKNISTQSFDFDSKINCFVGKNGIGKTNILDAIYHLAYGKSYFNPLASQNIKHDEDFFLIDAIFNKNEQEEKISCSLKRGQKKIIKRNNKIYEKLSEHIGFVPLVIISPSDTDLIVEGSETRRKFIDSVISTLDNKYLNELIQYQKLIAQRNALLKYFALNQIFDKDNLAIYDDQLEPLGKIIFEKRKHFLDQFIPIFQKYYTIISSEAETVQLIYQSQLFISDLTTLFKQNLNKDRALQYTSTGIHKDDLSFEIDNFPIKKFGSQGQQKSFLIALKLAQFEFIKEQSGELPILLFDDIFDKLDESRVSKIVTMVNDAVFGQIFISDTHAERTENIIKNTHQSYTIYNL
ncbi:DNA replication and repair protein RecF [Flavobacterium sediminilitoris]|uniref:DNA replication and repair protein RecF n=1 Tax=Flavobacterium sediminilitoris TaxID=2024526 RepID=A0ABY4HIS3_9FLAO|nr:MULTISPECIES: DNA replication and repair protein RecF [Flavobacterium]UOX32267.1 DNA replication and repair protein RecF [Flavobacterium sediminilitoris]